MTAVLGLSDAERTGVETAVAAAERRTAVHFAVVVAHASDDYAAYPMLWAAAIALIAGDVVALAWTDLATWWLVALQAVLFIVADLLLHLKPLRYRLVPSRVKKSHAKKLSRLEFAALIHDRAPGDVGLLLFLSEAERHVEILVDNGISARIDQTVWQKIVADLVVGVAAEQVAAALMAAIAGCTAILEQHFPPKPGLPGSISGTVKEI